MKFEKIIYYLKEAPLSELMAQADEVRRKYKGEHVHTRALIEFSNVCKRNCLYCGLRVSNRGRPRYRLEKAEILNIAINAAALGADTIVLQSGEAASDASWIAELITEINSKLALPITLSVGECAQDDYALWRRAGAKRFLLRHETSDPLLYSRLHPGYNLENRLKCQETLRKLAYECGGGFMVGLPGQSIESIAQDLILCKNLELDMVGVGPFLPQNDTPFATSSPGSLELALRAVAILRLLLPRANIPATTALASLDPIKGQILGLKAGANVLMPSFTPPNCADLYAIYDHKQHVSLEKAASDIRLAGRTHSLNICH